MGYVDYGKILLFDYICKVNVIVGEVGGIIQYIGVYYVILEDGCKIMFFDILGYEVFIVMCVCGVKVIDIVIIIVVVDDDVMFQIKEVINYVVVVGVFIVFVINKIDKFYVNFEKIKEILVQMNYFVEEWGGKYQLQDILVKKGFGVFELMEKVFFEVEMFDLKVNLNCNVMGFIIELILDKGCGYVVIVLVFNGMLKVGDIVFVGISYGCVKVMFNECNQCVVQVGLLELVLILGLNGVFVVGDIFYVIEIDQEVCEIVNKCEQLQCEQGLCIQKLLILDEVGCCIVLGNFQELNVIVKGDVDGFIEVLSDLLIKLFIEQIQVNVIYKVVGQILELDVILVVVLDVIIIGFQVCLLVFVCKFVEQEGVDICLYFVIYVVIEEVKVVMEGMFVLEVKEVVIVIIEVCEVFYIIKVGIVVGVVVKEGKVKCLDKVCLICDGIVIFLGFINVLKCFKDDVKEVGINFECGISFVNYNDLKVGDMIEIYEEVEVK